MPQWTKEQSRAISASGKFTVLSAAAGSGKTTVLVERAARLLLDKDRGTAADKLLIVTFSNASAAEFRKRIEDRITEALKADPANAHIQEQRVRLQNSDISTIHAFCIKLARENFQSLDISPDFVIRDEVQSEEIHDAAIDSAMAYGYSLPKFKELVSFYGKSSNDKDIRGFLRRMDTFFSALPHPEKAAREMAENYAGYGSMSLSPAFGELAKNLLDLSAYMVKITRQMDSLFEGCESSGYETAIEDACIIAERLYARAQRQDFAEMANILPAKPASIGRVKNKSEISEMVKDVFYAEYKSICEKLAGILKYIDEDRYHYQIALTEDYVKVLFRVFARYQRELMSLKKRRKIFEFSDFEHFAVRLLQDGEGRPTPLCLSLRRHYDYIMEDEYQDTSYVQDKIFTLLAKENMSNLYVVGDVKQSIYGFRKASPEIILEKRKLSAADPGLYSTLYLPHNFRSDYGIICRVNYIFTRLMTKDCGGVEYNQNEALQTLRPPDGRKAVRLNLYAEDEAGNTARLIGKLIQEGYTIREKGVSRPVAAGDFCILLRNKSKFSAYRRRLEELGYSAFVREDEIVLTKREVQSVINLLRVIQNPLQEVYLTAAMFGDIFEFSLDEILKIKYSHISANLYKSLSECGEDKAKQMLSALREFEYTAGVLSPDKLIDYICRKTGYYRRLAFSPDGGEKRENIRWFIDFAKNYASTHRTSDLAAFLRYTDRYIQSGKGAENENSAPKDAVSIMTMHKSKGLEFPVCIVAGLSTKFNRTDRRSRFFMSTDLGVGMYSNKKFGYNSSTLNIKAIQQATLRTDADEEMRLLYVAMTRAKNLLVLSGEYNANFSQKTLAKTAAISQTAPDPCYLRRANTPMHWVIAALAQHPDIAGGYTFARIDGSAPDCFEINLSADIPAREREAEEEKRAREIRVDMPKITANLSYSYPHLMRTKLPIKMSVSEIAKSTPLVLTKPDFIKGDRVSAAEKGTAMHRFAQHVDIAAARRNLDREIDRLSAAGLIEKHLLDMEAVEKFVHSKVADMILRAQTVYTERNFRAPYSAALALNRREYTGEEVLVQGVMDCVLKNGEEITVIDYKTDFVQNMRQLKDRYAKQLNLYRHGAKSLFDTDKIKCILYSFHLDDMIEIEP